MSLACCGIFLILELVRSGAVELGAAIFHSEVVKALSRYL